MKLISEFKEFISRGNVMDMAVGIVVGGAFTSIVKSFVDDIVNPFISFIISLISKAVSSAATVTGLDAETITSSMDLSEWTIGNTGISIGNFILAIINFLLLAFIVFCAIKALNTLHNKLEIKKEIEEAAEAAQSQEELLAEIRDLLKEQNNNQQ